MEESSKDVPVPEPRPRRQAPASVGRDLVERVKAAVDIVDVAGEYLTLVPKAGRFFALCPFHREKTPSFSVLPSRQIFHCFGCQKSGDVLTLVMEMERLSFPEALRLLAERAGIDVPRLEAGGGADAGRTRLRELLAIAAGVYAAELAGPRGAAARAYLERRGLSRETLERFGIGFAPDEWRFLSGALRARGFRDEELVRAGVAKAKDGGSPYDLLRNRVVIPIRDSRGRVIAFGGRVLDGSEPKYLNTPETELFSKRRVLFGLDVARAAGASRGTFVVVEGYMDAVAAHQHGLAHVVATLGTALTREHAADLRRLAPRALLVFDADEGGRRAADRGAPILLQEGLEVAIASLPDGQDPDEFLAEHGAAALEEWLESRSEELIDFLIRRAAEEAGGAGNVDAAARAARAVLAHVREMDDALRLDAYLRKISQAFGVDEALLRRDAGRGSARSAVPAAGGGKGSPAGGPAGRLPPGWLRDEMFVLQGLLTDPGLAQRGGKELSSDDFRDPRMKRLYVAVKRLIDDGHAVSSGILARRLDDDVEMASAHDLALGAEIPEGDSPGAAFERLKSRRAEDAYRRKRFEVSRAGTLGADQDPELDRWLAEAAEFHARRYRRGRAEDGSAARAEDGT